MSNPITTIRDVNLIELEPRDGEMVIRFWYTIHGALYGDEETSLVVRAVPDSQHAFSVIPQRIEAEPREGL